MSPSFFCACTLCYSSKSNMTDRDSDQVESVPGAELSCLQVMLSLKDPQVMARVEPSHPGSHLLSSQPVRSVLFPFYRWGCWGLKRLSALAYLLLCVQVWETSLGQCPNDLVAWRYRKSDFYFITADEFRKVKGRDAVQLSLWMKVLFCHVSN